MKVIITSDIPVVPITLGVELEKNGFSVQHALPAPPPPGNKITLALPMLKYGNGVSQADLGRIEKLLSPLTVTPMTDSNLAADEIHLELPLTQKLSTWDLTLKADTENLLNRLKETCIDSLGMTEDETSLAVVERNELVYGSAPPEVRQLLRWYLKTLGISVTENQKFDESDDDIYLHVRDPEADKLPPRERFRVHIVTDDIAAGKDFGCKLVEKGFRIGEVGSLDRDDLEKAPIGFGADWFEKGFFPSEISELRSLLVEFSRERGIDQERYPVTTCGDLSAGMDAVVSLPVRACLEKSRRPYAGPFPERFKLTIFTEGGGRAPPAQ